MFDTQQMAADPSYPTNPAALRKPASTSEFRIFLSSGSDLDIQRDQFEQLCNMIRDELVDTNHSVRIVLQRWEKTASFQVEEDPNERFRSMAEQAHLTVVLLKDSIRPGTRDELEAALKSDKTSVSILWMRSIESRDKENPPRGYKSLEKFLLKHRNRIIWNTCDEPDSFDSVLKMSKLVFHFVLSSIYQFNQTGGLGYFEKR